MEPIKVGTVLRTRYKITSIIFQSKLANVYIVEDQHLKGKVWAMKELQLLYADQAEKTRIIAKFQADVLNLSSLTHRNLPRIMDFFIEEDSAFVIRDLVPGTDLASIMKKRKEPFTEKEVLIWAGQIADCLIYLSSRKLQAVFYKELKLANILVEARTNVVKIIDLGLAAIFQPLSDYDALKTLGPSDYPVPEQFADPPSFDSRTLVYSLGCIIFNLIIGLNPAPLPLENRIDQLKKSEFSRGFKELVETAIRPDPRGRFQSLQEMKGRINELLKSSGAVPVAGEEEKKSSFLWNILIAVLVIAVMGLGLFLIYYFLFKPD